MPPAIAACARADGWQMDGYAAEINSLTKHTARTGYQHVTATVRQNHIGEHHPRNKHIAQTVPKGGECYSPTATNKHSTDQLKGTSGGNHHSRQQMISAVVRNYSPRGDSPGAGILAWAIPPRRLPSNGATPNCTAKPNGYRGCQASNHCQTRR